MKTFYDYFVEHAQQAPGKVAIIAPQADGHEVRYTYAQLRTQVDNFTQYLLRCYGNQPGVYPIGVCLDRGVAWVVAMLAIWQAGYTYVPISTNQDYAPDLRIQTINHHCQLRTIIAQSSNLARLQTLVSDTDTPVLLATEILSTPPTNPSATPLPPVPLDDKSIAYILYTSGSTGTPKGVAIGHQGIPCCFQGMNRILGVDSNDVTAQFAGISFDASICEVIMALGVGATLLIAPESERLNPKALGHTYRKYDVSVAIFTPTFLRQADPQDFFADQHPTSTTDLPISSSYAASSIEITASTLPRHKRLRIVSTGETLTQDVLYRWGLYCPIYNGYGPTEVTIATSMTQAFIDRPIYAGKLDGGIIDGLTVWIFPIDALETHSFKPVEAGQAGEIYLSGVGLAIGYYGDTPEVAIQNTQSFITIDHPHTPGEKLRLYRTFDAGTIGVDGSLTVNERLGRRYKLPGGKLINLDDVEADVRAVLDDTVAEIRVEIDPIKASLIAFIRLHKPIPDPTYTSSSSSSTMPSQTAQAFGLLQTPQDWQDLRDLLKQRLSYYAIPSQWYLLEQPFDIKPESGKIDSAKLLAYARAHTPQTLTAPNARALTSHEQELALMWRQMLPLALEQPIYAHDNFLELGGDSFGIVQLVLTIRAKYDFSEAIRLRLLHRWLQQHDLCCMAQGLATAKNEVVLPQVTYLMEAHQETKPPLFMIHALMGYAGLDYQALAAYWPEVSRGQQALYGVSAPSYTDKQQPDCMPSRMDLIVDAYLKVIQDKQAQHHKADAPYFLAGWSAGGVIAFAIAERLTHMGKKVFVQAIDSASPTLMQHAPAEAFYGMLQRTFKYICKYCTLTSDKFNTFDKFVETMGPRWQRLSKATQIQRLFTLARNTVAPTDQNLSGLYAAEGAMLACLTMSEPKLDSNAIVYIVPKTQRMHPQPKLGWQTVGIDAIMLSEDLTHMSVLTKPEPTRTMAELLASKCQLTPATTFHEIPLPIQHFVGRQALYHQLITGLNDTSPLIYQVVYGLGGMGKSSFINTCVSILRSQHDAYDKASQNVEVSFCSEALNDIAASQPQIDPRAISRFSTPQLKPYDFIAWLSATEGAAALVRCLQKQGYTVDPDDTYLSNNPQALSQHLYDVLMKRYRRVLLAWDGADNPKALRPHLPKRQLRQGSQLHILISSRSSHWHDMTMYPIGNFEPQDAHELVKAYLGNKESDKMIAALSQTLGYFPLALRQAIAYLLQGRSIKQYLEAYRRAPQYLLDYEHCDPDTLTVYKTFCISIEELQQQSPLALRLLFTASFFAPQRIPYHLIAASLRLKRIQVDLLLDQLKQYSFISNLQDDIFDMHEMLQTVVQLYLKTQVYEKGILLPHELAFATLPSEYQVDMLIQESIEPMAARHYFKTNMLSAIMPSYQNGYHMYLAKALFAMYTKVFLLSCKLDPYNPKNINHAEFKTFDDFGKLVNAIEHHVDSVLHHINKEAGTFCLAILISCLDGLGRIHFQSASPEKSLKYLVLIHDLINQKIEPEHFLLARFSFSSATCYNKLLDYKNAALFSNQTIQCLDHFYRYLTMRAEITTTHISSSTSVTPLILPSPHTSVFNAHHTSMSQQASTSSNTSTIVVESPSISSSPQALSPTHTLLCRKIDALLMLCDIYLDLDKPHKAQQQLQRIRKIERTHGLYGDLNDELLILWRQVNIHIQLQETDKIIAICDRILRKSKTAHGRKSSAYADNLADVAGTYVKILHDIPKAIRLCCQALTILERQYGADSLNIVLVLQGMANVYRASKTGFPKANTLLQRALIIQETFYGPNHVILVETLHALVELYDTFAHYEQQLQILLRVHNIQLVFYQNDNHPAIVETLAKLGITYGRLGEFNQKEKYLARALSIEESYYGRMSSKTYDTHMDLAALYQETGDYIKQGEILEHLLRVIRRSNKHDSRISTLLHALAFCKRSLGYFQEARTMLKSAISLRTRDNADTINFANKLWDLSIVEGNLGNYEEKESLVGQALEIYKLHFSQDTTDIAELKIELSDVYYALGQHDKELATMQEVLTIMLNHYSPDHPKIIEATVELARAYANGGNSLEAKNRLLPLLDSPIIVHPQQHPRIACMFFEELGPACFETGRDQDKEVYLQHALTLCQQHYGENHIESASIYEALGEAYRDLHRPQEALAMLMQAQAIRTEHPRPEFSPGLASKFNMNIGSVYLALGNLEQAQRELEQAVQIQQHGHPPSGYILAETAMYLGDLARQQDQIQQAKAHFHEAIAVAQRTFLVKPRLLGEILLKLAEVEHTFHEYTDAHEHSHEALTIFEQNTFPSEHPLIMQARQLIEATTMQALAPIMIADSHVQTPPISSTSQPSGTFTVAFPEDTSSSETNKEDPATEKRDSHNPASASTSSNSTSISQSIIQHSNGRYQPSSQTTAPPRKPQHCCGLL